MNQRRKIKGVFVLLAIVAQAGCATARFTYLPAGVAGKYANEGQRGRAYYAVPPEAPEGSVRTMYVGIVKLKADGGGPEIPAIAVRMIISNQNGSMPWSVKTRDQTISIPDVDGPLAPTFVESNSEISDLLKVKPGEIRMLNLYYQLPPSASSADEISDFDFHWQVQTTKQLVKETTSFDRIPLPSYYSYYSYPYYSWSYPFWPAYPFGYGFGFGWEGAPLVFAPPSTPIPPPNKPVIVGH